MQKKKKIIKIVMFGCLFATALLCGGCRRASSAEFKLQDGIELDVSESDEEQQASEDLQEDTSAPRGALEEEEQRENAFIYVQINGAVRAPGVYRMEEGDRVFAAIEKAGGMTEDAAAQAINQASVISDGQVITVYTYQEWEQLASQQGAQDAGLPAQNVEEDGRVNINTADLDTLCTIPGIGRTRAESIISYRDANGPFGSIEDIKNVSGIKDGLFEKIKDRIKV